MLWYVIQTYTGREERLMQMIRRVVPGGLYGDCFVVYHEQLRNRKQENQIHIERVFPGYAFITSDDPDELFFQLKRIPAMSKMLAAGEFCFTPLETPEAEFLDSVMDEDHVIRLSYAATDGRDHVNYLCGPLEVCGERILQYQFRKRYASVRLHISGQEKEVRMGIILNDDIRRELSYGKVEAPIIVPERYQVGNLPRTHGNASKDSGKGTRETIQSLFCEGDRIMIVAGAFSGMTATVCQIKKGSVKIKVHLFGRDITAEEPIENVRKVAA